MRRARRSRVREHPGPLACYHEDCGCMEDSKQLAPAAASYHVEKSVDNLTQPQTRIRSCDPSRPRRQSPAGRGYGHARAGRGLRRSDAAFPFGGLPGAVQGPRDLDGGADGMGRLLSGIDALRHHQHALGAGRSALGIALVSCGASALNQVIERKTDAKMMRTAQRPLAAGRIGLLHGLALGLACFAAGALVLAWFTNPVTVMLTLLTGFSYVAVYTPLKRYTTLATFIGAFPGAMPPLLGWTAARGVIEWPAVALFAILFVWQFPHFMAIAWLYREDYARAGIRMLPVVQPDGWSTAFEALIYAVLMIPVSVVPFYLHLTGRFYLVTAVLLGLVYLAYTIRFARITRALSTAESRGYARDLLRASVIYLPLLLTVMMLNATGRR